jgi:hypothetical protein
MYPRRTSSIEATHRLHHSTLPPGDTLRLLLLAMIMLILSQQAFARCAPLRSLEDELRSSTAVFVGTVTDLHFNDRNCVETSRRYGRDYRALCLHTVTFTVKNRIKGVTQLTIVLTNDLRGSAETGFGFSVGGTYLVYAGRSTRTGELSTTGCYRTGPIDRDRVKADLDVLLKRR